MAFLLLFLYFISLSSPAHGQHNFDQHMDNMYDVQLPTNRRFFARNKMDIEWINDWPCPLAEDIAPCTCGQQVNNLTKLEILCDGVVDINEIERVFSVDFPFSNLWSITFIVNDYDIWMNSSPLIIPKNIFQDKTAKEIWLNLKISEIHPLAFELTANYVEFLGISGPGFVDGVNPIEYFPMHILQDFSNLKSLLLQQTMLSDRTFEWDESRPPFDALVLPNLESLHIAGGMLTNIPKLCTAPKLREIRFAYHPIASIEPNAFSHLPHLESLDLAGNAIEQTMQVVETSALGISSANFSLLSMGEWEHLQSFSPGFISGIQPHTAMDFMSNKIDIISEEVFKKIFEILVQHDEVENCYPSKCPGHVSLGRNPLNCGCSIKWIVEDPVMLRIIDWPGLQDYGRPTCRDGTLVADLDIEILNALCPDN